MTYRGLGRMAQALAFQASYVGSIPTARSKSAGYTRSPYPAYGRLHRKAERLGVYLADPNRPPLPAPALSCTPLAGWGFFMEHGPNPPGTFQWR